MGSSILYSSTDASAPVLLDGVGSLANVLKKCLVTGYGTKAGLGWTQKYISPDGYQVVFRNKGTGFFLKVNNSINIANSGIAAMIETYEAMSSYEVGYLRTPELGVNHYISYANTKTNARVIPWKVLGDDKGFWFCTKFATYDGWGVSYLGDYIPYDLGNKYNWINFCSTSLDDYMAYLNTCGIGSVSYSLRTVRKYNNQLPCSKVGFHKGDGYDAASGYIGDFSYQGVSTYTTSPIPIFAKPILTQLPITGTLRYVIGEIPGLFYPLVNIVNNTITTYSSTKKLHTLIIQGLAGGYPRVSLLEGEGFRP